LKTDTPVGLTAARSDPPTKGNMTISQTPSSVTERRLKIARRLYQALVAQDPDRVITLCDSSGRVVARHDPRPEQGDPEIAS
jgi:hypothetical protein